MEYLHKLPFLFGAAAAIIVGVICNLISASQQDTYFRMAVSMVIFFVIGLYTRNTIIKIFDEIKEKKLEEESRLKAEHEAAIIAEEERVKLEAEQKLNGRQIDIKVDDDGEDFSPLTVSEYIKSQ